MSVEEKKVNEKVATFEKPHVCVLSQTTLDVLQNISLFCPHFVSDECNHLRMFVPGAIIIYELPENELLPDFAIPSIAAFINTCNVFKEDELAFAFTDKFIQISDNTSYLRLLYVIKEILHLPKSYNYPSSMFKQYNKYKAKINISSDIIKKIKKVSSFMKLKMLEIKLIDGKGKLTLRNPDVGFDTIYCTDVEGEGTSAINIQITNMKFIVGDYECSFDETRVQFLNKDIPLRYIITNTKILNDQEMVDTKKLD